MTNTARHFIVARMGAEVIIREVTAESCSRTLTRQEAWSLAARMGQPVTANSGNKHGRLNLVFVGLDMQRRDLGPAPEKGAEKPQTEAPAPEAQPAGLKPFKGGCTDKQLDFIQKLRAERDMEAMTERPTFESAQNWITTLLDQPKAPKPSEAPQSASQPVVVDGRYALRNEDGIVKFYKVENGKEGTRWAGYTFLKAQASDDLYPIKNRDERDRILALIAQDPKGTLALYGQELGKCGRCNRTLTDETSRANGIGPECITKV